LLRAHHDRIYAVCRRVAGNDADAADATQEALLAIVRGLARFDGRAAFTTWSYRVATNACLDELRRRGRRPAPTDLDEHRATTADPDVAIDATVTDRMVLDHALAQIPEEFRVPVVLRDVGGLDYAEIAETLGIPPGTVRSRISRGRSALARVLAGNQLAGPDRPTDAP
jgi:RNA polymerase sigma-70 factor (ECF subfamily)